MPRITRHCRDKVDFFGQELNAEQLFDRAYDGAHIAGNEKPHADTDQHAGGSDEGALNHKDAHDRTARCAWVRRIAMSLRLELTVITNEETRPNAPTKTIRNKMMPIMRFST